MASYTATVSSPHSADAVFRYLRDFRTVKEWDPSITTSDLKSGEVGEVGATYEVVTELAGSSTTLVYEMTEVQVPSRLVVHGESNGVTSIDTITVTPRSEGGVDVTYDAQLDPKGVRKLADPALHLVFKRVGGNARDGLAKRLAQPLP